MSSFQALKDKRSARHAHQWKGNDITLHADEEGATRSAMGPTTSAPTQATDSPFAQELAGVPLEVRSTPSHGRGLYATERIAAGTTILQTTPRVAALGTGQLLTHCSGCFRQTSVKRCAACKALHYCSAACQQADWSAHKSECAALTRMRRMWARTYPDRAKNPNDNGFVVHEAQRCMGRMCWARKVARDAPGASGQDPAWWHQVTAMESHASRLDEKGTMRLANQVQHLRHYLGAATPTDQIDVLHPAALADFGFTSAKELLDMASAFSVNSFTLSTPDLTPIGVATSPVCALFNHSCKPNAVIVFPKCGAGMHVVAIADIAPGQEVGKPDLTRLMIKVLTSYIDVSLPKADRQQDLQERYGFTCDCSLCRSTEVDPRWSVLHPGCRERGFGPMPDLCRAGDATVRCTCGVSFTLEVTPLRRLVESGRRPLEQDEKGELDREVALPLLQTLRPELTQRLPPSSHPLLQLLRLNALLLTPPRTLAERDRAVELLTAAAEGARASHPPNHPTVAVILAERAKLLAMAPEDFSPADRVTMDAAGKERRVSELIRTVDALRQAAGMCDVGFGKGNEVGAEMRSLAAGCENELDMLRR